MVYTSTSGAFDYQGEWTYEPVDRGPRLTVAVRSGLRDESAVGRLPHNALLRVGRMTMQRELESFQRLLAA